MSREQTSQNFRKSMTLADMKRSESPWQESPSQEKQVPGSNPNESKRKSNLQAKSKTEQGEQCLSGTITQSEIESYSQKA
jgi:hypothetical protein